jgi:hypothetical protein
VRIVDRATFLALPSGTLFSKFSPHIFGELSIKGATQSGIDFWYQDLAGAIESTDTGDWADRLEAAVERGAVLRMDFDCMGRDGLFDADQLFAVWDARDTRMLIDRLERALAEAGKDPQ